VTNTCISLLAKLLKITEKQNGRIRYEEIKILSGGGGHFRTTDI